MQFAHFAHVWGKAGLGPHDRYEMLWRELQAADEFGFDYAFSVEHHFTPFESWMSSPNLYAVAAAARTKRLRVGAMGHVVALHHPVRLLEEIALCDQLTGGRLEVGLVPGILPSYFAPFKVPFGDRRAVTLEFARFLKAAYAGDGHVEWDGDRIPYGDFDLSVMPMQRPHPPLWIETRDVDTLAFCAREGISTGYFLLFPRSDAKSRYAPYIEAWKESGWPGVPRIAYSTVVYVGRTDREALDTALRDAANAYKGFFYAPSGDLDELRAKQVETADYFAQRGDAGSAEIALNMLDADYLLEKELILLGSPATVAAKLRRWAEEGSFNTFFGEFNFGDLGEDDVLNSICLFGSEVMPQLRDFEPF
jgi:alkanesulfonate monooxygenase SsuD/methylene tetrahydromethanopterin reductase-like flavin-dependent oxidoreductase (luciferase family)